MSNSERDIVRFSYGPTFEYGLRKGLTPLLSGLACLALSLGSSKAVDAVDTPLLTDAHTIAAPVVDFPYFHVNEPIIGSDGTLEASPSSGEISMRDLNAHITTESIEDIYGNQDAVADRLLQIVIQQKSNFPQTGTFSAYLYRPGIDQLRFSDFTYPPTEGSFNGENRVRFMPGYTITDVGNTSTDEISSKPFTKAVIAAFEDKVKGTEFDNNKARIGESANYRLQYTVAQYEDLTNIARSFGLKGIGELDYAIQSGQYPGLKERAEQVIFATNEPLSGRSLIVYAEPSPSDNSKGAELCKINTNVVNEEMHILKEKRTLRTSASVLAFAAGIIGAAASTAMPFRRRRVADGITAPDQGIQRAAEQGITSLAETLQVLAFRHAEAKKPSSNTIFVRPKFELYQRLSISVGLCAIAFVGLSQALSDERGRIDIASLPSATPHDALPTAQATKSCSSTMLVLEESSLDQSLPIKVLIPSGVPVPDRLDGSPHSHGRK